MIAIVIPYFNLLFFEETLKSLSNQSNKNFKAYIYNDNSPQNPQFLIDEYKNRFDFEYISFNNNLGGISLVKQWHRCLENIKEPWLSIIGDDDILNSNYIAAFYENIDSITSQDIKLIRCSSVIINDKGEQIKDLLNHPKIENSIESLIRKITGKNRSSLSEYIYRNDEDLKKHFIDFPNAYYSDDLSLLLATNFSNIFTINESIVQIRRGNFNLSGVNSNIKKANQAEFLFYKYLINNYYKNFDIAQKKLFLHKLNRLVIRTKSFTIFFFVIKNQIKINDFIGLLYFPRLFLKKLSCQLKLKK